MIGFKRKASEIETCLFYSVQRLISEKNLGDAAESPSLRFGELFKLDYMGASEYEFGAFPKFMREVHEHQENLVGVEVDIEGMAVFVVYSTHNNTQEHVLEQLKAIAQGKQYTKGGASFKKPGEAAVKKPRMGSRAARQAEADAMFRVDGWAEISLTTFWTVLPMTLERYKQLIANSVAYMDEQKRLREGES